MSGCGAIGPRSRTARTAAAKSAATDAGMPAGGVIFNGTHPTCTASADGSFACSLAAAPDMTDAATKGDYTGTIEVLVVDGKAAGGCIALDASGMSWTCYVGQDSVDHGMISKDFLGEPAGPGRG